MAALLAISQPTQAATLIGNYPFQNDVISTTLGTNGVTNSLKAVGFTLPTGSNYTLNSITLRLESYNTSTGDTALVQIFADAAKTSNNPTGAILQSVLFNNPSSSSDAAGNFDFTPQSSFTFLADTRYWLGASAPSGNYNWRGNNPGIAPTGISGIVNNGYQISFNNGATYFSSSVFNTFQVNATLVPFEFNPALGLGVIGGFFLVRKVLKKKA